MKKFKVIFVSLILIFVGCFFAGCGFIGKDGTQITISEDGYWVIDGQKTEYKVAAEDGEKGEKGEKGDPASISIDEEGYWVIDGKPTNVKARGEDGQDGTDGKDGEDGKDGQDGMDGTQITISEDGYWVLDGESTTSRAVGKDGTNGTDGVNGTVVTIEDGYWVLDGVKTNIRAEAQDGEDGEDGQTPTVEIIGGYWYINGQPTGVDARGEAGNDGEDGTQITISADGYWVLDGVKTNVRAKAQDGEDGEDGQTPTVEIIDGYWYINGQPTGVDARGQNGEDGEDGKSAYELAVLNGFDGTEEEWLETLGITQVEAKNFNKSINKALVSSVAILSCFNNSTSASLSGAGVIIQDDKDAGDAYILTCYHVVYDTQFSNPNATTIRCYLYGQYRYSGSLLTNYVMPATLIGYSVSNDIAVLKISNSDIYRNSIAEPVTYRDSDELNICDDVLVLGNPGSLDFSASTGIVSMESEIINYPQPNGTSYLSRFIRTDAAINGGNSGGGMFDIDGNFIGTVKGKYSVDSYGVSLDYMGLVVPSNLSYVLAKNIINNCNGSTKQNAEVVNTGLDITIDYVNMQKDENNNIKIVENVKFTDTISTSSDFWQGGVGAVLRNKKVVSLTLNKGTDNEIYKKITRSFQFEEFLYQANVGDELTIEFENNGVLQTKTAILTQTKNIA